MTLSRRNLIELSVAGAAAMAAGNRSVIAASQPYDEVRDSALAFFTGRDHIEIPPLEMITGDDFNGGLRYDESRATAPDRPWVGVQPAARIDDIAERNRPGVLASFNIISVGHPGDQGEPLDAILAFLVEERGLVPERMVFVSTDHFRPLIERFETVGKGSFIERDFAEAKAAGDGSGYFAPAGHPYGPAQHSVGIYYPLDAAASDAKLAYPPAGHIEIADIGIPPADTASGPQSGGIGLERVAMAEGKQVPDFEETRLNLLRIIEDEARREGKPLPPGYTTFASL